MTILPYINPEAKPVPCVSLFLWHARAALGQLSVRKMAGMNRHLKAKNMPLQEGKNEYVNREVAGVDY
jgi:hypothetical protein